MEGTAGPFLGDVEALTISEAGTFLAHTLRICLLRPKLSVVGPFGKNYISDLDKKDRSIWVHIVQAAGSCREDQRCSGDGTRKRLSPSTSRLSWM